MTMGRAQDTEVLLLVEPTTFLGINHQLELLDLLTDLNRRSGTTILCVLHDLSAEADANRTRLSRVAAHTGFEDRNH